MKQQHRTIKRYLPTGSYLHSICQPEAQPTRKLRAQRDFLYTIATGDHYYSWGPFQGWIPRLAA